MVDLAYLQRDQQGIWGRGAAAFPKSVFWGVLDIAAIFWGLSNQCCIFSILYFQQYFFDVLFTRYLSKHCYSLLSHCT